MGDQQSGLFVYKEHLRPKRGSYHSGPCCKFAIFFLNITFIRNLGLGQQFALFSTRVETLCHQPQGLKCLMSKNENLSTFNRI